MKNVDSLYERFKKNFLTAKKTEEFRNAVGGKISSLEEDAGYLEKASDFLCEWFGERLFSLGYILKKLKLYCEERNYGSDIGVALSIRGEKDKINVGRWIQLLQIDSQKRKIEGLKSEIGYKEEWWRKELIKEHNKLIELAGDGRIPEEIRESIEDDFSYLFPSEGEDEDEDDE